jgi:uncharacterized protein (DUF779 family)
MPPKAAASRITATMAAREAIAGLRVAGGGPVMFVQSAGCCDGSDPMCYSLGEFSVGDLLLGEIDGCPFYMDERQYEALGRPRLVLDARPGEPGGFSLAAGDGQHFVVGEAATADTKPSLEGERS